MTLKLLLKIVIVLLVTTSVSAEIFKGNLFFSLTPWSTNCIYHEASEMPECDIPRALFQSKNIEIKVLDAPAPGSIARSFVDFSFEDEIFGRLEIYSKHPEIGSEFPPYLVVQLWVNYPTKIFCSTLVEWSIPFVMPPLICAGESEPNRRLGITTVLKNHIY